MIQQQDWVVILSAFFLLLSFLPSSPFSLYPFLHNHCRHIPINNLNTIALFEIEFQSNVLVEHNELISPFTQLTVIFVHWSGTNGAEVAFSIYSVWKLLISEFQCSLISVLVSYFTYSLHIFDVLCKWFPTFFTMSKYSGPPLCMQRYLWYFLLN